MRDLIRSKIVPQLRSKLGKLGADLINAHAKDIQHAPGENPSSGFTKPKYLSSSSLNKTASSGGASTTQVAASGAQVNVVTVTDRTEFRTTAEELFKTFTDAQRLAAFTRGTPKKFEGAEKGCKFELFDGNVAGEFVELEAPTKVVQSWRLATWPAGHYSTQTITFEQDSENGVTFMNVRWDGVPVGQVEVTKTNWNEYYVRSIKTTFGFGTVL